MSPIHERELKILDKKITELSAALAKASHDGGKALKEVLIHIHNPGWTTPAELAFSNLIIDGILNQLQNINKQIEGLNKSSGIVAVK